MSCRDVNAKDEEGDADAEGLPLPLTALQEAIADFVQPDADELACGSMDGGMASDAEGMPEAGGDDGSRGSDDPSLWECQASGNLDAEAASGEMEAEDGDGEAGASRTCLTILGLCDVSRLREDKTSCLVPAKRSRKAISQYYSEEESFALGAGSRSASPPAGAAQSQAVRDHCRLRAGGGAKPETKRRRKKAHGKARDVSDSATEREGRAKSVLTVGPGRQYSIFPPHRDGPKKKRRLHLSREAGGAITKRSTSSHRAARKAGEGAKHKGKGKSTGEGKGTGAGSAQAQGSDPGAEESSDYGSWDSGKDEQDMAWWPGGSVFIGRNVLRSLMEGDEAVGRAYGKVVDWVPARCLECGMPPPSPAWPCRDACCCCLAAARACASGEHVRREPGPGACFDGGRRGAAASCPACVCLA